MSSVEENPIGRAIATTLASEREHTTSGCVLQNDSADTHAEAQLLPTSRYGMIVTAVLVVVVAIGGSAAVAAFRPPADRMRSSMIAAGARAAMASVPRPAPSADDVIEVDSAEAEAEAAAPAPAPDATSGALIFPPAAAGHRVYIDGRVVGDASSEMRVPCGRHVIRVGSRGYDRSLSVPCGGQIVTAYP